MIYFNDLEVGKEYFILNNYECCEGWSIDNHPEKVSLISITENEIDIIVSFKGNPYDKREYISKKDYKGNVVKKEDMSLYFVFETFEDMIQELKKSL